MEKESWKLTTDLEEGLSFHVYQRLAQRTANHALTKEQKLINAALGLGGEVGEVQDIIKKHLAQGHELNRDRIIDEAGDVMWYLAELAEALDTTLEYIVDFNLRKLKQRYPKGFEVARSINRE